jgi:hypothetical protein
MAQRSTNKHEKHKSKFPRNFSPIQGDSSPSMADQRNPASEHGSDPSQRPLHDSFESTDHVPASNSSLDGHGQPQNALSSRGSQDSRPLPPNISLPPSQESFSDAPTTTRSSLSFFGGAMATFDSFAVLTENMTHESEDGSGGPSPEDFGDGIFSVEYIQQDWEKS